MEGITNPALGSGLQNLSGIGFFATFIPKMVGLVFVVGVLVFFFVLAMGAIQWISSGGDKQGLEGARAKISNGLIGLFVLFASFAIIKLIEAFFGINILELDIGGLKIE